VHAAVGEGGARHRAQGIGEADVVWDLAAGGKVAARRLKRAA